MKPSEKLKKRREMSGRDPHEVAAAIGISSAEYYDLEGFDDLENCLDLGKIKALAFLLGMRPADLFSEHAPGTPDAFRAFLEKYPKSAWRDLAEYYSKYGYTGERS